MRAVAASVLTTLTVADLPPACRAVRMPRTRRRRPLLDAAPRRARGERRLPDRLRSAATAA